VAIPNPAKCEVCSVIRFLNVKEAPAEIHCRFVSVYGELLVHEIVKERSEYSKLCARWAPKLLTENHKKNRMGAALTFVMRYMEGDEFLDSIVIGDEMWVFHHTPESKQQLLEWRHTHSALKRKFKTSTSTSRVMATVFWDRKGVLLVNYMPHRTTVNAAAYCETKRLRYAIENRRRGMMTSSICLLLQLGNFRKSLLQPRHRSQ